MSNLTQDQFNSAAREFIQDVVIDHSPYDLVGSEIDEGLAYLLSEFLETQEPEWDEYDTEELANMFSEEVQNVEIGSEVHMPELIWDSDIMEFWEEFEDECDENWNDHGNDANDNDTVRGLISDVVAYTLHDMAENVLQCVKDDFQTSFADTITN